MKKIMFLGVAVAIMGFYAFPVFLAQADSAVPTLGTRASATSTLNTVLHLHITAYSSDVDQTDDTPFITANGTYVRDGIVATNLLPFGTKVKIPELFGDKIFTVEDRMNARMTGRMDVWMPSRAKALFFGSNYANVVVLGNPMPSIAKTNVVDQPIADAGK